MRSLLRRLFKLHEPDAPVTVDSALAELARSLGIDPGGKTETEIVEALTKKFQKPELWQGKGLGAFGGSGSHRFLSGTPEVRGGASSPIGMPSRRRW
jgi:post-segregation antitoxin (ccd killing protein)